MKALLIILLMGFGSTSLAVESTTEATAPASQETLMNINKGNWEVGGNLSVGHGSYSGLTTQISPQGLYFLEDKLALGLSTSFYFSKSFKDQSVGPVIKYYIWSKERVVAHIGASVRYERRDSKFSSVQVTESSVGRFTTGMDYFITPSVAFGLAVNYTTELNSSVEWAQEDTIRTVASFGVFL